MKTLVVYYSRTGNTRGVAEKIAELLHADLDEIIDKKNRSGMIGYLSAGKDAMTKANIDIGYKLNPADYDMVVLGTPIWGSTITPALRTYLTAHSGTIKKTAFFATSGGSGIGKIAQEMEQLSTKPIAQLLLKTKLGKKGIDVTVHSDALQSFCTDIEKNSM
jgi:flavodoxin